MSEKGGSVSFINNLRERVGLKKEPRLVCSADTEVSLIHKALGVTFNQVPRKIICPTDSDFLEDARFWAERLFRNREGALEKAKIELISRYLASLIRKDMGGYYGLKSKTCYVASYEHGYRDIDFYNLLDLPRGVTLYSLHEAMHAYHAEKDKSNLGTGGEGILAVGDYLQAIEGAGSSEERQRSTEALVVQNSLSEGIAEWGSRETHSYIVSLYKEKAVQRKKERSGWELPSLPTLVDVFNLGTMPIFIRTDDDAIGEILLMVERNLADLKPGKMSLKQKLEAVRTIQQSLHATYFLGYRFVDDVVFELTRGGFDKVKALDTLICNPPGSLQEINNVGSYFSRVEI